MVVQELVRSGATVQRDVQTQLLTVNGRHRLRLIVARCRGGKGFDRWKLRLYSPVKPDVTLIARLASDNETILDYLSVPWRDEGLAQITLGLDNIDAIGAQRFSDFAFLNDLAARSK
jgi:hypothetical protein